MSRQRTRTQSRIIFFTIVLTAVKFVSSMMPHKGVGKGMSDTETASLFNQFRANARSILSLPQSVIYQGGNPLQVRQSLIDMSEKIDNDPEASKNEICQLASVCLLAATLTLFGPLLVSRVTLNQDLKLNAEGAAFIKVVSGTIPLTMQGATKNSICQALPELGIVAESSGKPNPTILSLPLKRNCRIYMEQQLSLTLDPNGSNSMSQGARAASIAQAKEGSQITMTYGGQNIKAYVVSMMPLLDKELKFTSNNALAVALETTVSKISEMISFSSRNSAWSDIFWIYSQAFQVSLDVPMHTVNRQLVVSFLTNASAATNMALTSAFNSTAGIGTQQRAEEVARGHERIAALSGQADTDDDDGQRSASEMLSMYPSQPQLPQGQSFFPSSSPMAPPFNAGGIHPPSSLTSAAPFQKVAISVRQQQPTAQPQSEQAQPSPDMGSAVTDSKTTPEAQQQPPQPPLSGSSKAPAATAETVSTMQQMLGEVAKRLGEEVL